MTDATWALLVLLPAIGLGLFQAWKGYAPPDAHIRSREPDPSVWAAAYAADEQTLVAAVVDCICCCFSLGPEGTAKLRPTDRLIDIYKAAYPAPDGSDDLEFETLAYELEKRFGVPRAQCEKITDACIDDVVAWARLGGALSQAMPTGL